MNTFQKYNSKSKGELKCQKDITTLKLNYYTVLKHFYTRNPRRHSGGLFKGILKTEFKKEQMFEF